ncbi:MAG: Co2+/Mg2+ efflux protein ApaG [Porticoccaceae bacterium]|nr:Co2+/Mg2+ efflux protein ApaG [Porticoccaceae bacterium]
MTSNAADISEAVEVEIETQYLPQQSAPESSQYAFAYHVSIHNRGRRAATLRSRHWVIVDGNQMRREVEGDGVVGKQPTIEPGDTFVYTSAVVLDTPVGTMQGRYHMEEQGGRLFAAGIAPFLLCVPSLVH